MLTFALIENIEKADETKSCGLMQSIKDVNSHSVVICLNQKPHSRINIFPMSPIETEPFWMTLGTVLPPQPAEWP